MRSVRVSSTLAVLLILSAAITPLFMNLNIIPSPCQRSKLLGVLFSHVFQFLMLNTLVYAILVKAHRSSSNMSEGCGFSPTLSFMYETEYENGEWPQDCSFRNKADDTTEKYSDSDIYSDDMNDENYDSDISSNDDDDIVYGYSSSDAYDKEDYDDDNNDDLKRRSDEFIAKIVWGWKEELLREFSSDSVSSNSSV